MSDLSSLFTADFVEQHRKMFKDLYFGDGGEPAITVRLERGENKMTEIKNDQSDIKSDLQAIRSFVRQAVIASIGSAVLVVGSFIAELLLRYR